MFMERNRRLNGAESPSKTMAANASAQRGQDSILTNEALPKSGQKRTFQPKRPSAQQINAEFPKRFEQDDWEGGYEGNIPNGPRMGGTDPAEVAYTLKSQGRG